MEANNTHKLTEEQEKNRQKVWPKGWPKECIGECNFCTFIDFWCTSCGYSDGDFVDNTDRY